MGKGFGIAAIAIVLLNIAWISFVVWAIYTLVTSVAGALN